METQEQPKMWRQWRTWKQRGKKVGGAEQEVDQIKGIVFGEQGIDEEEWQRIVTLSIDAVAVCTRAMMEIALEAAGKYDEEAIDAILACDAFYEMFGVITLTERVASAAQVLVALGYLAAQGKGVGA